MTFTPHCAIVVVFLTVNPYLVKMRKSKPSQLTGGEETPGESVPQQYLLLCDWGLHAGGAGGITEIGNSVVGVGTEMVAGLVGQHGPLFVAWQMD